MYFPSVCLVAWREVSVVDKMTTLRVQRFGVGIPVGSRVLYPLQDVQKVSGFLPAYCWGVPSIFFTPLHLKPRLRMNGAIPLFPLYAFMAWTWPTLFYHLWWPYAVFSCYCLVETCLWRVSLSGVEAPFVILQPLSEYNERNDKRWRYIDDHMRRCDSICGRNKPLD